MTFYVKFSPSHAPLEWMETPKPLQGYNTRETSAVNGKPYLAEATREGYEPFDPATQVRTGPVLEASPPVIRYTVSPLPDSVLALRQISALESTVTQRRLREAIRSTAGKAWLDNLDDQIIALRTKVTLA